MNRLTTLIALLTMTIASHAWLIDYDCKTTRASISGSSLQVLNLIMRSSWFNAAQAYKSIVNGEPRIVTLWLNNNPIYNVVDVKPSAQSDTKISGFLVGKDNTDSLQFNISCGLSANSPIKQLEIDYVLIDDNDNAHPTTCGNIGKVTYSPLVKNDGLKWGHMVIEPYLPVTSVTLTYNKDLKTTNLSPLAKAWDNGLAGCVVNYIAATYADNNIVGEATDALLQDYKQKTDEWLYLKDVIQMLQRDGDILQSHYAMSSRADVDENGTINSADIVSIYNTILSGSSEYNGHRYVDLGLPSGTKWASCNVGSASSEGLGDYYAYYDYHGYIHDGKREFSYTNYNEVPKSIHYDWEGWQLPSTEDYTELISNTTYKLEYINGARCGVFTSNINGAKLIFPLYGYISDTGFDNEDTGYYWTSTGISNSPNEAISCCLMNNSTIRKRTQKHLGLCMRYVCKP